MSDMTICDLGTYCNVLARKHLLTADFPLQTITQCREHDKIEAYMKMESSKCSSIVQGEMGLTTEMEGQWSFSCWEGGSTGI